MTNHPLTKVKLRLSATALGIVLLFWIPVEDTTLVPALLLGTAICALTLVALWTKISKMTKAQTVVVAFAGLLAGGAVPVVAALLAIFKNGLHSHGYPDFINAQLLDLLTRIPVWSAAGMFTAFGVHLLNKRSSQ